jgi:hypothetical protein
MPKQMLNEAERFLLQHWGEARLLEESMETVRTKYKEVFDRIVEAVTEAHPELDAHAEYPTQFWGPGSIGFGRKSWPGGESRWPSGFWLDNVRLEKLSAEESEEPLGSIWFSNKSKSNLDFDAARVAVNNAAKEVLTADEQKKTETADSDDVLLYLPGPSKAELLQALSDGDDQAFVEIFVSQFDMMARFVPVLDSVFRDFVQKK